MRLRDLTGQRFGQWTVIKRGKDRTSHATYWECLCDCGLISDIGRESLIRGRSSCVCVKRNVMIGKSFYDWTVLDGPFQGTDRTQNAWWDCRCICGREGKVSTTLLRRGGSKGCGCVAIQKMTQAATKHGLSKTHEYQMYSGAKNRAKKEGLEFNLDLTDLRIPETCPILNIPLFRGTGKSKWSSPSLDRLVPAKGYTKDNVWIISNRANTIKNDATLAELELITNALRLKLEEINGLSL